MRLWLEDKLRPAAPPDPWSRDALSVAVLLVLTAALVPAWDVTADNLHQVVVGEMASWLLLPALGFLLALRTGAVDLSVWVVAGVGGLVAAALLTRGVPPVQAFAAAGGAGLAIGCLNAALVVWAGLPSPAATLLTGLAAMWTSWALVSGRDLVVPEQVVTPWIDWHPTPALALRVLAVLAVYVSVLVVLTAVDAAAWRHRRLPRRPGVFAALAASAMLAALGGAVWLLESRWAPVPWRLVGDLRIPAAALLAGGAFLARPGRELLAGMSLPPAMLIATVWRQKVWLLPTAWGYDLQLVVLIGMVAGTQIALARFAAVRASPRARNWPLAAAILTLAGMALVASAASAAAPGALLAAPILRAAGMVLWLAGTTAIVISSRSAPGPQAQR